MSARNRLAAKAARRAEREAHKRPLPDRPPSTPTPRRSKGMPPTDAAQARLERAETKREEREQRTLALARGSRS